MLRKKLAEAFRLLYKNIVTILLVATVFVVLVVGYSTFNQKAVYTAEAEIIVHNGDLGNVALGSGENATSFIPSVEKLFNSTSVFEHFKGQFMQESAYTPDDLASMIKVKANGKNSIFMTVTVTAETSDEAVRMLSDFTSCLGDYIHFVANSINIAVVNTETEASLLRADIPVLVAVSFIGGAVVAALFVLIFGGGSRRLQGVADYKANYSLPVIGTVPDFESKGGK